MTEAAADAAARLARARARLVLDRPFLGALALQLPAEAAGSWCRSTATDGRRLYYAPAWIARLGEAELQSALCREALHCALGHLHRRGRRRRRRWQAACDYAVHALLAAEGMPLPEGALHEPQFAGLAAEEIYPCLDELAERDGQELRLRDEGAPAGGGAPRPLAGAEREELAQSWRARLERAAAAARNAGTLPAGLERALAPHRKHRLPWRQLLARHAWAAARADYSYQRPSTRREGPAIHPSLRGRGINLAAALDVSGSVPDAELAAFLGELDALKGALRARVAVLACDRALSADSPRVFEPWEPLRPPARLPGGGGTSFLPVFEWADAQDVRPDLLVYFTDARGRFPAAPPAYPVLWLVRGGAPVPWGERVQLN